MGTNTTSRKVINLFREPTSQPPWVGGLLCCQRRHSVTGDTPVNPFASRWRQGIRSGGRTRKEGSSGPGMRHQDRAFAHSYAAHNRDLEPTFVSR